MARRRAAKAELADDRQPVRRDQEAARRPVEPRAVHRAEPATLVLAAHVARPVRRQRVVLERLVRASDGFVATSCAVRRRHRRCPQQAFSIVALDTIWLPAAFEPRGITAGNTAVRYEPDSSTLIVGTSLPNSNGVSYLVQSALPTFDPAKLAAGHRPAPCRARRPKRRKLPADLDPRVKQEARGRHGERSDAVREGAGAAGLLPRQLHVRPQRPAGPERQRDRRLPLREQAWLLRAVRRHVRGDGAVDRAAHPGRGRVHARRRGPEQARHVPRAGPARPRVARGVPAGQGWVPFEPTPTRGAPNAQQYTNVPEQQATEGGGATTVPTTSVATTPTTAGASGHDDAPQRARAGRRPPDHRPSRRSGRPALRRPCPDRAARCCCVLAIIYVITVPIAVRHLPPPPAKGRERARRAGPPRVAGERRGGADLGVSPWRSETAAEFGHRADRAIGAEEFPVLAGLVSAADYSADGVDDEQAVDRRSG